MTPVHQDGLKVAQKSTSGSAIGTAECVRCSKRWGGLNTAHCSAENCHQTFTGIKAFDAHRAGNHSPSPRRGHAERHCLIPEKVGLVDAGRKYPCWGHPSDGQDWWTDE